MDEDAAVARELAAGTRGLVGLRGGDTRGDAFLDLSEVSSREVARACDPSACLAFLD